MGQAEERSLLAPIFEEYGGQHIRRNHQSMVFRDLQLTWFNLARFSTCEDLIKEYKYDNVPNKESSFKNILSYLEFMKSVKIGTGPLYGHFKIIHLWSDIQYMYIDIYKYVY